MPAQLADRWISGPTLTGWNAGRRAALLAAIRAPSDAAKPSMIPCIIYPFLRASLALCAMARRSGNGICLRQSGRVQRKLERQPGGDRQMVDILGAILTDGLEAVEAACSEALAHNVHSAGVVLNILARHREPPPPLTITTPDASRRRRASGTTAELRACRRLRPI